MAGCIDSRRCRRPHRAVGLAALQSDFSHELRLAGRYSGAYVYDLTAKQALFSERASTLRPPASVEKLYTATTALELMGPSATLTTAVLGSGSIAAGGVWEGNLYLRGGGDPTFGSAAFIRSHYGGQGATVTELANRLVKVDGIHEIIGSVVGDESYFDSLRGEPSSDYAPDPFLEGTLSGLAFNRGQSGSEKGHHAPAAYAARELWRALANDGVKVSGPIRVGLTPAGATPLRTGSIPDARAPARPDASSLGQLLRGDADQGPRCTLRRSGNDARREPRW